jgi:hypothetical protein
VNLALAAITAVVVGGAVVAVTARDARATLLGLLVVLLGSAVLADPLPGPLPIAARMAAAFLACRLIAVAIRGDGVLTSGSLLGWPVDVLAAVAALLVGVGTHGLGATPAGPVTAQAAGFAVGVLAVAPIVSGRDVLRLGVGAMLLLVAASLVRVGLAGTPWDLELLVECGLVVGLGGVIAIIVGGARAASGDLVISGEAIRDLAFDPAPSRELLRPAVGSSIHIGRAGRVGGAGQASKLRDDADAGSADAAGRAAAPSADAEVGRASAPRADAEVGRASAPRGGGGGQASVPGTDSQTGTDDQPSVHPVEPKASRPGPRPGSAGGGTGRAAPGRRPTADGRPAADGGRPGRPPRRRPGPKTDDSDSGSDTT